MIHGGGCYNSGDFASAITAAEKGYKVALDPFYSAGSLVFLLLFYLSDRQMSKINEHIEELVSYCTLNKNEFTGGPAKIISAINAIDKGEYNKGMEHLQSSIDDCRERHRYGILPAIELALGNLFLEIAKGDQKASAAAIFKNIGFVIKHAIVAGKRASEHFNAAIHYADQVNAIGLKGQAYYGLGILNKIKRKYEIAGEYFEKSIDIFQETGAYSYLDQAENELGNLPQKTYA
jgi:tetratricopeptide (TPR) repeat protein